LIDFDRFDEIDFDCRSRERAKETDRGREGERERKKEREKERDIDRDSELDNKCEATQGGNDCSAYIPQPSFG
jgi:hypothetical protein